MIENYLTDLIDIISITYDQWGSPTTSTQSDIKARIEDNNKMVRNIDGQEVAGQGPVFVDHEAILTYTDRIKLKERNGVSTGIADKEFAIKSLEKAHGFMESHWEIYI